MTQATRPTAVPSMNDTSCPSAPRGEEHRGEACRPSNEGLHPAVIKQCGEARQLSSFERGLILRVLERPYLMRAGDKGTALADYLDDLLAAYRSNLIGRVEHLSDECTPDETGSLEPRGSRDTAKASTGKARRPTNAGHGSRRRRMRRFARSLHPSQRLREAAAMGC